MPGSPPIGPVLIGANELLDQLYEETERLLREKEPAVHYLAKALIERGRADRRGARGGLRRDRGDLPVPAPAVRAQAHPVPKFGSHDRGAGEPWQEPAKEEAAAADEPAASIGAGADPATDEPTWQPSRRPGMPTDVVPPWARH